MRISDWSSDVCSSVLEVVARIERDAVLAVVQVFVIGEVGVLVVQFAVDRPVRAEELADADGAERSIVGHALGVLEVVADAAGDVPAVVELLRIGGLHAADAGEQRGTEEFLVTQGSAPLIRGRDRKSVGEGKSGSVRVGSGGPRILKQK